MNMVFFLECVAACVLFTAALEALAAKRREVFVNDYPPVVTEKLRALGIVAEKPPARKSDILRKLIAVVSSPWSLPWRCAASTASPPSPRRR